MSERPEGKLSCTAGTGDIRCPFFVMHGKREIRCEGIIAGTRSSVVFQGEEDKEFHQKTYCENQYCRCEQYCSIRHWQWPEE